MNARARIRSAADGAGGILPAARKWGIPHRTLCRILAGGPPSLENAVLLADAIDASDRWLGRWLRAEACILGKLPNL
jgi:hypothetical protein